MLKRISILAALVLVGFTKAVPEPQNGVVITITAATAIRLIPNPSTGNPVKANSILIQALHGGTGVVYVLYAPPNVTCANGGAGTTFVAELTPASATGPGGAFSFPGNDSATNSSSGFDVRGYCIDGSHSGDTVAASWDLRN